MEDSLIPCDVCHLQISFDTFEQHSKLHRKQLQEFRQNAKQPKFDEAKHDIEKQTPDEHGPQQLPDGSPAGLNKMLIIPCDECGRRFSADDFLSHQTAHQLDRVEKINAPKPLDSQSYEAKTANSKNVWPIFRQQKRNFEDFSNNSNKRQKFGVESQPTPTSDKTHYSSSEPSSRLLSSNRKKFMPDLGQQENVADKTFVRGMIPAIKSVLETRKNYDFGLCDSSLVFFYRSYSDRGWGCGFRNIQTLSSIFLPHSSTYRTLFDGKCVIPDIFFLQKCLDYAHSQGYDPQGFKELRHTQGTRKWIGAVDAAALLRSYGIPAAVFDFKLSSKHHSHTALFEWVWNYFNESRHNWTRTRQVAPLFFQHAGHSRTIVGAIQNRKTKIIQLVVLDPDCFGGGWKLLQDVKDKKINRVLRVKNSMKKNEYQIVKISRFGLMSNSEQERSKIIISTAIGSKV